jgi:hypothetical protein
MNVASYNQVAQEGLFTKKKTVEDLLATAQKKVSRLKTVEDVDAKMQAVNESGKAVNTTLKTMADAAKKRAAGSMDDKEFKAAIKDASKSIASPIKTLYSKLGNVVESKAGVTSDEIQAFQKYLSGLKKLLNDRKKELAKASAAKESYEDIEDPELRAILESLDAELSDAEEACAPKKKKKKCKVTESEDEKCDPDDEECKKDKDEEDDDSDESDEDEEDEDEDESDDEDEDDDDYEEDSEEESCKESVTFSEDELNEYAASCESMMNDDFDFEVAEESVSESSDLLNADGTLKF